MSRPRLTGGRARRRPLPAPVPSSARPTSSRVREALFSLVGHDLEGRTVLDAFGGSGLLGLEAWSRGGAVTIVEKNPKAIRGIRQNADGLGAAVDVVRADVLGWDGGRFDVVLADPPYRLDRQRVLEGLVERVGDVLVLEGDTAGDAPAHPALVMLRERCYGGTRLWLYGREELG